MTLIELAYRGHLPARHLTLPHVRYRETVPPELKGIPGYASAIAIEIRAGPALDNRDFARIKFRNGTDTGNFETLTAFGHRGDVHLTEFIYSLEVRSGIPIPPR